MKKETGLEYVWLALYAFGGIGLEVLLAFWLEPLVYGVQMAEWSMGQSILHWILICVLWGSVAVILYKYAKKTFGFDMLASGEKIKGWQWLLIVVYVIVSLVISYVDWNGSKASSHTAYIFRTIYTMIKQSPYKPTPALEFVLAP